MTSEQFAEQPLPPEKKRCPHCGEIMPANAQMCWLCLEKYSVQEGAPPHAVGTRAGQRPNIAKFGDNAAWVFLGVLVLLLAGALAFAAPGILIALLIVATPAVVRTVVLSKQAAPNGGGSVVGTFFGALGVAVLVGLASFVAFFATCFVVCLVGMPIAERDHFRNVELLATASIGAGLVPGVAVAVWLFKYFWKKKG